MCNRQRLSNGDVLEDKMEDYQNSSVGMCRKLKFGSDLVFRKPNCPKFIYPFRRFFDRNYMQSTIQIKLNKSNFTCIKSADKERFKIRLKQSLAYSF